MPEPSSKLPLFVDLDGTLTKSDLSLESLLALIRHNILYLVAIPFWLLRGRAFLKARLADLTDIPVTQLPWNPEFLAYLKREKKQGRDITLISASNQQLVDKVNQHLTLFNASIGSDETINLKSRNKLKHIQQLVGSNNFAYAGNSSADIPIWSEAREIIMVNCSDALGRKLPSKNASTLNFDSHNPGVETLLSALRPHQWLKNGLLFVPLILAHQLDQWQLLVQAAIGFISFSLCASSVYLINDMFDLDNDRLHRSKFARPFASGDLSLSTGFISAPLLLAAALLIAALLPWGFLAILTGYWLLTFFYSLFLKRLFLLDVVTLALLYTVRVVAGAAAVTVIPTPWLIAFSLSLFLGLAIVKRVTELSKTLSEGKSDIEGRAYSGKHMRLLEAIGGLSGLVAVGVFILYINDPNTTGLYSSPGILWAICPLLLYLLMRIWSYARAGKLEEDPVLFAITDHISQGIVLAAGVIIWLAS